MANVILFTDRTPYTGKIEGESFQFERFSRPGGAYKVATTLRRQGYSVLVVPNILRLSLKGLKDFINNNSKDLLWVGISTTFFTVRSGQIETYRDLWLHSKDQTIDLSILQADRYQKVQSDMPTQLVWGTDELRALSVWLDERHRSRLTLGGGWVSEIKNGAIDAGLARVDVITGQSEDYIVEYTDSLMKGSDIPWQFGKAGEKEFRESYMDYTSNDIISPDEWLPIEIARGCSFRCAYCTYDHKGKDDTTKHVKILRDELIRNYELHGVTKYHLLDDLYNDSDDKIKRLYDDVWSKLPFKPEWISYLRLDLIWHNKEQAEWLEASGCKLGSFGIETLHTKAGQKVGKGLGKERIIETLEHLRSVWGDRVLVTALMIAGLPHEPYEHIQETMEWFRSTDLVHDYIYNALWVTPPEHKDLVIKQNDMSQDYEKYGLSWGPDGWINNVGVTLRDVTNLIKEDGENRLNNHFPVDLIEYPDLRTNGYTHAQLSDKKFNSTIIKDIKEGRYSIKQRIDERFGKIISLSGR